MHSFRELWSEVARLHFSYQDFVTYSSTMSTSKSPPSIWSPAVTTTRSTTPLQGEATIVSIFIADKDNNGEPTSTLSPFLTFVSRTTPGIGAPMLPATPFSALGL
mmetsp:Transcript_19648/g.34551  ORF Transcript_19648/g.34551 Transcript_19648/m.34551 type:complete len:105 (+) Transcript_19648:59-373(+)